MIARPLHRPAHAPVVPPQSKSLRHGLSPRWAFALGLSVLATVGCSSSADTMGEDWNQSENSLSIPAGTYALTLCGPSGQAALTLRSAGGRLFAIFSDKLPIEISSSGAFEHRSLRRGDLGADVTVRSGTVEVNGNTLFVKYRLKHDYSFIHEDKAFRGTLDTQTKRSASCSLRTSVVRVTGTFEGDQISPQTKTVSVTVSESAGFFSLSSNRFQNVPVDPSGTFAYSNPPEYAFGTLKDGLLEITVGLKDGTTSYWDKFTGTGFIEP